MRLACLSLMLTAAVANCFQPCFSHEVATKEKWIVVPVFFVSDRKQPIPGLGKISGPEKDVLMPMIEDPGEAQPANYQSVSAGIIEVPIKIGLNNNLPVEELLKWGCRKASDDDVKKLKNIKSQLAWSYATRSGFFSSQLFHPSLTVLYDKIVLDPFRNALGKTAGGIVFLHGCCETQEDSIRKGAELSLRTGQPVFMYDWGSVKASTPVSSYMQSLRALEVSQIVSERAFVFLTANLDTSKLSVIAHSLGNWLLCDSLSRLPTTKVPEFAQIHMVRPDVSRSAFFLQCEKICSHAKATYVYHSTNDLALYSSALSSSSIPRLGRPADLLPIVRHKKPGPNCPSFIDVSAVPAKSFQHEIPFELLREMLNTNSVPKTYEMIPLESKCMFRAVPHH